MTSLKYDDVYSGFFSMVEAYDFIDLSDESVNEFLCNWLHSAVANSHVRKLFSSVGFHDETGELKFEMKYVVDEDSDKEFVLEILSLGIARNWLKKKVNSITNISQLVGSKDEKFYSQSQHLSELRALQADLRKQQRGMIADRGSAWNTYLAGE